MELTADLKKRGFSLLDTSEKDVNDFIRVEKVAHSKYVLEHSDFFGEWKEEVLVNAFHDRRKMTFFKKLMWNDEIVGYMVFIKFERIIKRILYNSICRGNKNKSSAKLV